MAQEAVERLIELTLQRGKHVLELAELLSPAAQIDGRLVEQIVSDLVEATEAPR